MPTTLSRRPVRPTTGEQPSADAPSLQRMAAGHLAASVRDSRRILNEALAAAQDRADSLVDRMRFTLDVALRPGMTAADVYAECLTVLHFGGHGLLPQSVALDLCTAMLEGWELRTGGTR